MSNVPEHDEERNGATGQHDQTPTVNENVAGNVPAEITTDTPGDGGNAPPDAADTPPAPQPQLFAVIDDERTAVPFADLTDEPRRLQFKQRCQQADAPVTLHATEFFAWPDSACYPLLKLVKELGEQVRLQLGDDQQYYPNVFDAVVAAFPTAASHTAAKQAAIMAAAVFLTENVWPAAAITIADGLTAIGAQNVAAREVFDCIRKVAGIVVDAKKPDPAALASHFHGCLQLDTRTPTGEPALRYFRDDFYAWNGRTWQRVDDKELKARVTRHIQQAFHIPITETLKALLKRVHPLGRERATATPVAVPLSQPFVPSLPDGILVPLDALADAHPAAVYLQQRNFDPAARGNLRGGGCRTERVWWRRQRTCGLCQIVRLTSQPAELKNMAHRPETRAGSAGSNAHSGMPCPLNAKLCGDHYANVTHHHDLCLEFP
jgi:hypothetical protein